MRDLRCHEEKNQIPKLRVRVKDNSLLGRH